MSQFDTGEEVKLVPINVGEQERIAQENQLKAVQAEISDLMTDHRAWTRSLANLQAQVETVKKDLDAYRANIVAAAQADLDVLQTQKVAVQVNISDAQRKLDNLNHLCEVVQTSLDQSQKQIDDKWVVLSTEAARIVQLDRDTQVQVSLVAQDRARLDADQKAHEREYGRKSSELVSRESILALNERNYQQRLDAISKRR